MSSYVLFISEEKLKDSTAINGNVDVEFLLPYIRTAQREIIEGKLGTDLYNKLKTLISGGTISTGANSDYKKLIDEYVSDALVHWAFYKCIPFLRFKISNGNIYSKTSETGESLTTEEAQQLREEVRNTAEFYTERLIDFIRNNVEKYPEYSTNSGADRSPEKNAYYSGMNLEKKVYDRKTGITLNDFLDADLQM